MKFNKIIAAFAFALVIGGHSSAYGSADILNKDLLEGDSGAEKAHNALIRYSGPLAELDITLFPTSGLGKAHARQFKRAKIAWDGIVLWYNTLIAACDSMAEAFPDNILAGRSYKPITSEEFNNDLPWSTLNMKLTAFMGKHKAVVKKVEDAFLEHLKNDYSALEENVSKVTGNFASMDGRYARPAVPAPEDVEDEEDAEVLFPKAEALRLASGAYQGQLKAAQTWQIAFEKIDSAYNTLIAERASTLSQFEAIAVVYAENPYVDTDVDVLPVLPATADLATLREALAAGEAVLVPVRTRFTLAKDWRPAPPVVALVEEEEVLPADDGDGDGDGADVVVGDGDAPADDGDAPAGDGAEDGAVPVAAAPVDDAAVPVGDGDAPAGDGDGDAPAGDGDGDDAVVDEL